MKRFLCLTAITITMLCMTACGKGEDKKPDSKNSGTSSSLEIDAQYTDLGGVEIATNASDESVTSTTETTTAETTEVTESSSDNGGSGNGSGSGGSSYNNGGYKAIASGNLKIDENHNTIITDNLRLVPAPDAESTHPNLNFGVVTDEDGETLDILSLTPKEFKEATGGYMIGVYLRHNTDDFYFKGTPCDNGIYLELITPENKLYGDVPAKDLVDNCKIKGFAFDDYTEYNIQGVTIGMSSIQVEQLLGQGYRGCDFIDDNGNEDERYNVIYKSDTTTLVVTYVHGKTYTGEEVGVVANLFVLKND